MIKAKEFIKNCIDESEMIAIDIISSNYYKAVIASIGIIMQWEYITSTDEKIKKIRDYIDDNDLTIASVESHSYAVGTYMTIQIYNNKEIL